jgi:hypothetical protein
LLWEFRVNHVQWRTELFDEAPYGFDVQYRDTEFFASHRFDLREAAIGWAHVQRGEIEKGGAELNTTPVLTVDKPVSANDSPFVRSRGRQGTYAHRGGSRRPCGYSNSRIDQALELTERPRETAPHSSRQG